MAEEKKVKTQLSPLWKRVQLIMMITVVLIVAIGGYFIFSNSGNEDDQQQPVRQEATDNPYK